MTFDPDAAHVQTEPAHVMSPRHSASSSHATPLPTSAKRLDGSFDVHIYFVIEHELYAKATYVIEIIRRGMGEILKCLCITVACKFSAVTFSIPLRRPHIYF